MTTQNAHNIAAPKSPQHPIDELLRARLRIHEGADFWLAMLRNVIYGVDALCRTVTGRAFFSAREGEAVLSDLEGLEGADFIRGLLARNGGTKIVAHGLENIPKSGGVIIASTHPIGTFDFLTHAGALLDHRPDLKVVANREAERFLGREMMVAVDFDRSDRVLTARQTRQGMIDHLNDGGALLIFGSGKVPDCKGGRLIEPEWKSGVTRMSSHCDVPIVPASPKMCNSAHYYRTRKWARILSGNNAYIGREVAALRYSSELLAKLGGTYEVFYGPPLAAGTQPAELQRIAESLVPSLYK